MSGWDFLVVAILAGIVIVGVAFDQLHAAGHRDDDVDRRRLMQEIRRQP